MVQFWPGLCSTFILHDFVYVRNEGSEETRMCSVSVKNTVPKTYAYMIMHKGSIF